MARPRRAASSRPRHTVCRSARRRCSSGASGARRTPSAARAWPTGCARASPCRRAAAAAFGTIAGRARAPAGSPWGGGRRQEAAGSGAWRAGSWRQAGRRPGHRAGRRGRGRGEGGVGEAAHAAGAGTALRTTRSPAHEHKAGDGHDSRSGAALSAATNNSQTHISKPISRPVGRTVYTEGGDLGQCAGSNYAPVPLLQRCGPGKCAARRQRRATGYFCCFRLCAADRQRPDRRRHALPSTPPFRWRAPHPLGAGHAPPSGFGLGPRVGRASHASAAAESGTAPRRNRSCGDPPGRSSTARLERARCRAACAGVEAGGDTSGRRAPCALLRRRGAAAASASGVRPANDLRRQRAGRRPPLRHSATPVRVS